MHERMAVLAESLEVVERQRHVRIVNVLRSQVNDVVNHLCWHKLSVFIAAFAHHGRDDTEWRVNGPLHVGLAVVKPSWRMIEGDGPILCHYDQLPSSVQWVKSLRRPH